MDFSSMFAKVVAVIGGAALVARKMQGVPKRCGLGQAPEIPDAKPQGAHPDLEDADRAGLERRTDAVAAPGLKVNAFATGLDHPRWIEVLPNGDVLIAESNADRRAAPRACFTMRCRRRCGAPMRSASAPTASRCCVTRTATASPRCAALSWKD